MSGESAAALRNENTIELYNTSHKCENYVDFRQPLLSESQLLEFERLQSDKEKIEFIAVLENAYVGDSGTSGKDFHHALDLKEKGNVEFRNKRYDKAIQFYSLALRKAPTADNEDVGKNDANLIAILYANRSACSYYLQNYEHSIRDINSAFGYRYPKHLSYKLYDRKAKCYRAIGDHKMTEENVNLCLHSIELADISVSKKQQLEQSIRLLSKMNVNKNPGELKTRIKDVGESVKKLNPLYKSMDAAIQIEYSSETGRFAKSTRNIRAGEIILVEDAYCSVLLEKYCNTHCDYCFRRVELPYFCTNCETVVYCSIECANIALSTYHKFECPILNALWMSNLSVTCLMALRIITQKPLRYFLVHKQRIKNYKWSQTKKYDNRDYATVHFLVSHSDRRTMHDTISRIRVALFLTRCLCRTSYFHNSPSTNEQGLNDDQFYITELLLHNLQILQFNAHEVSELQLGKNSGMNSSCSIFLGGALYPTLALFNHSCDPAVIRYFQGTKVVVRAIKNIPTGGQIAENYGPLFTQMTTEERRHNLQTHYWFQCACEPCTANWPKLDEMCCSKVLPFRCTNSKCHSKIEINSDADDLFSIRCPTCVKKFDVLYALKLLQATDGMFIRAKNLLEEKRIDEATNEFLRLFHRLDDVLKPPFKDYYLCQQELKTCYLMKGNYYGDEKSGCFP